MEQGLISARIIFLGIVVLGMMGIIATLQRQMIYFPAVAGEPALLEEARRLGLEPWRDENQALIGWRSTGDEEGKQRMLVFHGNAGYAQHRNYYVQGLRALRQGWQVYLFEYPGYGARAGSPSEASIKSSAERAARQLLAQDSRPLFLLGESLGSGVACHLAATFPGQVAGLLLVTPFPSLVDVAAHHYWFLPVRMLLQERFDSMQALSRYRGPAAFLLAGQDEVVPKELGRRLHDAYRGPRWLREIPGAGHNSLPMYPDADWWGEATGFLLQASDARIATPGP
jgi:pimeloyl-ACP methyl ester carboxylesterase